MPLSGGAHTAPPDVKATFPQTVKAISGIVRFRYWEALNVPAIHDRRQDVHESFTIGPHVAPEGRPAPLTGGQMKKETEIVRIDLTKLQKDQVKGSTGRDAEAIELTIEELEARIAPRRIT